MISLLRARPVLLLALASLPLLAPAQAATVPTPGSVLGFTLGEDRTLADWTQLVGYYRALDAASDRVQMQEVGRTTEDQPFLVITVSSEANLKRLSAIRTANLRLADPRGLGEAEARTLVAEGKTIVALNHGIHSDEVAASQTAAETAYWLASSDTPEVREILESTVVVMIPSHNPDGTESVVRWYRSTVGTAYEGADVPFLYQKYVGHDNNRDWYMFTQKESRLTVEHLYDTWRPQIVHDLHQMGSRAARLFVPPYVDPWEPNVDPALRAAVNGLGAHMAAQLVAEGKKGVVIHALYDAWTPARAYPHTHAGIRILSEAAEAKMASPREMKLEDLAAGVGYDPKTVSWNNPAPWPGGLWRLRDVMDYQFSATRALLLHAARHRTYWLQNFLDVSRRAVAAAAPSAFVIPLSQRDPRATAKLLEVLHTGGVELQRARAPIAAEGRTFEPGSHVVQSGQPYFGFAKTVLEKQQYPNLRQYPGGPPQRPYDVTAHTLPLLLGVDVVAVKEPLLGDFEKVVAPAPMPGSVSGRGRSYALGHKNAELVALGRLLEARVPVRWATASFTDRGRTFPAGTLLVPAVARKHLEALARELGFVAWAVDMRPADPLTLVAPRVGLYESFNPSMDAGWTRFVFEHQLGIRYETLRNRDVRAGRLRERFDAIVLPDESLPSLLKGRAAGTLPDEYAGGIGAEGVAALKAFAEAGGTLIALDSASAIAGELGLPVRDVLGEKEAKEAFYSPGALLEVEVDTARPLAHGWEPRAPIWFENSPAFEAPAGNVVARYGAADPLRSGWLLGGERLEGKAALLDLPLGRGRVVLFGFRPQYRAQSFSTYMPLANAIYLSAATASRAPRTGEAAPSANR